MENKGFTFLELIIVVVIVGILAAMTIPNMSTTVERTRSRSAKYNLVAIYNAQKRFKLRNNVYFYTGATNATKANINANLNLNIEDSYFTYNITPYTHTDGGIGFNATATRFGKGLCVKSKMFITSDNSTPNTHECSSW
jgi:prepilin-type N-terminal cleavage/methylation domain-containing protein